MSVGAGRLKGRRLAIPDGIRPSSGRLKEALFSIWGERLRGAAFADLFAGGGGVGIEAWSRGAAGVTFVERDRRSLAALRRNLSLVSDEGARRVLATPVIEALEKLAREGARFDLLFADPPYARVLDERFFRLARAIAAPDAMLVVEHRAGSAPADPQPGWRRALERRYGDSALSLYEVEAREPETPASPTSVPK